MLYKSVPLLRIRILEKDRLTDTYLLLKSESGLNEPLKVINIEPSFEDLDSDFGNRQSERWANEHGLTARLFLSKIRIQL